MLGCPLVLLISSAVMGWRIRCSESTRDPHCKLVVTVGVV